MKTIWPFSFYFLLFSGFAFIAPFMVLFYQDLGFNGAQIGLLTGLAPLLTLVSSPLWTGLADSTRRHRLVLSINVGMAMLAILLFSYAQVFWFVLAAALAFNLFIAPVVSFGDSATMHILGERRALYGRVRLGGTIGWALAAPTAGLLVQNFGLTAAFRGCAVILLLCLLVSQKLRFTQVQGEEANRGKIRDLLSNRSWYYFLAIAFAGGLALAAVNNYLSPLMESLGASASKIGLAWTLGTVAEFPVLYFGDRLIRKFKPQGVLFMAMVITGLRLILFATARHPDTILALQLFNGLTFPAMWMAGVAYADANAPASLSSTGQGLFNAMVWGFGSAAGGFLGGPLLDIYGGSGVFLIFGLSVLIIVVPVTFFQNRAAAQLETA